MDKKFYIDSNLSCYSVLILFMSPESPKCGFFDKLPDFLTQDTALYMTTILIIVDPEHLGDAFSDHLLDQSNIYTRSPPKDDNVINEFPFNVFFAKIYNPQLFIKTHLRDMIELA